MKITTKLKTISLASLALAIASLASVVPVHADGLEVSISPVQDKAALIPGKSYSSSLQVHVNVESAGAFKYKAYVTPYSIVDNDYSAADYINKGGSNTIVDWITFDDNTDTGVIEPDGTVLVKYTINVPANANPGGQYAAIMIEDDSGADNSSSTEGALNLGSKYRLAYTIYGTVAGDIKESGDILENNINTFFLDSKVGGTSLVENTGNVHFDAAYTLRVFPLFSDEEIYSNEEDPDTWIIMPGTTRFISTSWEETPSIGIFNVEQEVKVFDQISKTSKLVIVMPIWLLLAIVFVIVFWIIWLVMRNKNRKAAGKGKGKGKSPSNSSTHSDHKSEKSEKPESPDKPKSPDAE